MIQRFKIKLGKPVIVRSRGVTYQGILKMVTETDAHIRGDFKLWAIPLDSIQSIEELDPNKSKSPALNDSIWKEED